MKNIFLFSILKKKIISIIQHVYDVPTSSVLIIIFFYVTSDNIFRNSLAKIKLFIEYLIILNFSCRPYNWMIDILLCVSLFLLQINIMFTKLCHYSY